jgi:hypothetical protein
MVKQAPTKFIARGREFCTEAEATRHEELAEAHEKYKDARREPYERNQMNDYLTHRSLPERDRVLLIQRPSLLPADFRDEWPGGGNKEFRDMIHNLNDDNFAEIARVEGAGARMEADLFDGLS